MGRRQHLPYSPVANFSDNVFGQERLGGACRRNFTGIPEGEALQNLKQRIDPTPLSMTYLGPRATGRSTVGQHPTPRESAARIGAHFEAHPHCQCSVVDVCQSYGHKEEVKRHQETNDHQERPWTQPCLLIALHTSSTSSSFSRPGSHCRWPEAWRSLMLVENCLLPCFHWMWTAIHKDGDLFDEPAGERERRSLVTTALRASKMRWT